MITKKLKFSLIKAVLYSFMLNVAMGAVMFLYASFKIDDMKAYLSTLIILVFFSALYSYIKVNISRPLLYNVASVIGFAFFNIILALLIGSFNYGWELIMVEWLNNIAIGAYLIIVLIDTLTCCIVKAREKSK